MITDIKDDFAATAFGSVQSKLRNSLSSFHGSSSSVKRVHVSNQSDAQETLYRPSADVAPARRPENFSAQLSLAVSCITTNRVTMAPMVTARPVKPSKKNA